MSGKLQDSYDFVCKKFNISLFMIRERLTITVNWVAPRYKHTGTLLHISSKYDTRIGTNKIELGDKRNLDHHEFSLRNTNYSYADVIAEFENIIATTGK